jgi:hypothetical protein
MTLDAINEVETVDFKSQDKDFLNEPEAGFAKRLGDCFCGCVGAVDGLSVAVRKPFLRETIFPAQYKNRKKFFSLNVQALCDSDLRFTHISITCCGSTHDWSSWRLSPLHEEIEQNGLPKGYWIAMDDEYVTSEYYIGPFPGKGIGKVKDTFNFYQSKTRIHIEQAFGVLVCRWGILWPKLECSMKYWSLIVLCCMKLHNICTDCRLQYLNPFGARRNFGLNDTAGDNQSDGVMNFRAQQEVAETWDYGVTRHRGRETSLLRDYLALQLSQNGFARPHYSNYASL